MLIETNNRFRSRRAFRERGAAASRRCLCAGALAHGNRADAEDVVQEACLRAFRGIGNFSNGNACAWVLTIVRHTAYGWLRKNRPGTLVLVQDVEDAGRVQSGEPDDETPETALIAKADAGYSRRGLRRCRRRSEKR